MTTLAAPVQSLKRGRNKEEQEKSAPDLLTFLKDTGSPRKILEEAVRWTREQITVSGGPHTSSLSFEQALERAKEQKRDIPTAEILYRHLEATNCKQGTLRKAGKWIWGDEFEPESVVLQAPADELLNLRRQNEMLSQNLRNKSADCLGLSQQNTHLLDRVNDLERKVRYLSMNKSAAELAAAGINTPSVAEPK